MDLISDVSALLLVRVEGSCSGGGGGGSSSEGVRCGRAAALLDLSLGSRHEPIWAASGSEEVHGQEASNVKLNANRVVIGTLRGFDQFMNLVVDNTVEVNGNEKNDIGMVVIRGNSVVMIEALEPVAKAQ
ncbi:hypothetical protein ACP4OV_019081 [Aristida adscensionis]